MTRRHFTFACEGSALAASLDEAPGNVGLLIVSGGNEVRSGAWSGQAQIAAWIAQAGHPVLRFDRRGVGDSEGGNGGFRSSAADIAAALAAFRGECPQLKQVVAWGNCDAASALMLAQGAGCDGLILSKPLDYRGHHGQNRPPPSCAITIANEWLIPPRSSACSPARYRSANWQASLLGAAKPAPAAPLLTGLAGEMASGIEGFSRPVHFLIADRDRTAQAFLAAWTKDDPRIWRCADATHSFVEPHAREWLAQRLLEALGD